jgi:hypothetical protein
MNRITFLFDVAGIHEERNAHLPVALHHAATRILSGCLDNLK